MRPRQCLAWWTLVIGVFQGFAAETAPPPQSILITDPRLGIHGLPWFKEDAPVLRRLPARLQATFRPDVWGLAQSPSGGRIRFRTDSRHVGIVARNPGTGAMHHMTSVGQNGFDLYVGDGYFGSAWPDADGRIVRDWELGRTNALRDVTIYLPLYQGVSIEALHLDAGARLEPPTPYRVPKPIVYYGSSITQGGCAANAGSSCQAFLERWLGADFVNLGFSGSGLGDPEVARAITELDPSCVVLDFWANPPAERYREALPRFVAILRARFPTTPLLVVSPFYFPAEALGGTAAQAQAAKRAIAREFVAQQQAAGDRHISFVDGLQMLGPDQVDGLVDGVHCNTLGFYFNAKGLEPFLRKVLPAAKPRAHRL